MIEADWDVKGCKSTRDIKICEESWIDYPGKGKIYDSEVAKFTLKHLRFRDMLNPEKIIKAGLVAQEVLMGCIDEPKGKWYFAFEKK